jgi:predicted transcriptional regulator
MTAGSLCSESLLTADVNDRLEDVTRLMREHAVRRVPVRDGDQTVGILSLGDLAVSQDRKSTLGEISAAPPMQ